MNTNSQQSNDANPDHADLWAMWNGFDDADALKDWGERAERERMVDQPPKGANLPVNTGRK